MALAIRRPKSGATTRVVGDLAGRFARTTSGEDARHIERDGRRTNAARNTARRTGRRASAAVVDQAPTSNGSGTTSQRKALKGKRREPRLHRRASHRSAERTDGTTVDRRRSAASFSAVDVGPRAIGNYQFFTKRSLSAGVSANECERPAAIAAVGSPRVALVATSTTRNTSFGMPRSLRLRHPELVSTSRVRRFPGGNPRPGGG